MATAAQIAARERFAKMARSGAFARKAKRNPAKKTVSQKISQLMREGYPQKQAVAIALSEKREGKVKANPAKKSTASNPRASNPVLLIRDIGSSSKKRQRNPASKSYIVSAANAAGKPGKAIATFGSARDAKQFAQSYADAKGKRMTVSS